MLLVDQATRDICDFLWYGFLPGAERAQQKFTDLSKLIEDDSIEVFDRHSTVSMKDLLCRIIEEQTTKLGADTVLLSLSSGLDSRGILGALLEIFEEKSIIAYTLGHAGTADHDSARRFTRGVLTNHHIIGVEQTDWNTAEIVAKVRRRPEGRVVAIGEFQEGSVGSALELDPAVPKLVGFLGDAISGKRLPKIISGCWAEAVDHFIRRNHAYKGDMEILPPDYDPIASLPAQPLVGSMRILLDDQLDLCFRQEQRIRPGGGSVGDRKPGAADASSSLRNRLIRPYEDPRWVRSFLLVPTQLRMGQQLYLRFLARGFRRIFPDLQRSHGRLSGKRRLLEELVGIKPRAGKESKFHVDFDHLFRTNPKFRTFSEENIRDLAARHVVDWVDFDGLLGRLRDRAEGRYGRLLYALISLEINFKTGKLTANAPRSTAPSHSA